MLAEAYGPVVLKPKGSSWRTKRSEGGGCLYDYAAHPLNLVNWYFGTPKGVGGSVLNKIFSKETDDEVFGTLYFDGGKSAQISVNWSDGLWKMSTKISSGAQPVELRPIARSAKVYLRDTAQMPPGYQQGWNSRYTTDLTEPVWFIYAEEYSAQLDYFVKCIEENRAHDNVNSFESALATDKVISMMIADAEKGASVQSSDALPDAPKKKKGLFVALR